MPMENANTAVLDIKFRVIKGHVWDNQLNNQLDNQIVLKFNIEMAMVFVEIVPLEWVRPLMVKLANILMNAKQIKFETRMEIADATLVMCWQKMA